MGDRGTLAFNYPGGRQPLSVDHIGKLPQTPLLNAAPGQFPHQSALPGARPGYPGGSSGIAARPGSGPSMGIIGNKGTFPSNEVVVQPLVPKNWKKEVAYEKYQSPGDIMFVRREQDGHVSSSATLNLPQMNEHLRLGYKLVKSQGTAKPRTNLSYQGEAIDSVDERVLEGLKAYRAEGEAGLTADPKMKKAIATDRKMKLLTFVSKEHIIDAYNFAGTNMNNDGKEGKVNMSIIIAVKGPTHYQETINYWGSILDEDNLFLILTRRKADAGYAEFQWVPYAGRKGYPPSSMTHYFDDAGMRQEAFVVFVGRAYYRPLKTPEQYMCDKLLAYTASSMEAADMAKFAPKVSIVLGIPKHRYEIFPC